MLQTLKYFLFGSKVSQPTCKRHVRFTHADQEIYNNWLHEKIYLKWTPYLFKAYHFDKANIRPDYKLERLQQLSNNGVIFSYDDRIGHQNFKFLFEYLKDRTLLLGYRLHSADTRNCQKNSYTETIHKYYLTPPPACLKESILCNQLYGTVSIDLILIDSQPAFVRIMANAYVSCAFAKALSFDDLLAHLFEHPACS